MQPNLSACAPGPEAAAALQAHHLYHQIRPPRGRVLDAVLQAQQALQEREEPVQGAAGISAGLTSLPRPQRGPLQQPLQHSTEFSLSALLAAAAAGGSCEQAAALRVAASFNLIDMSKGGSGRVSNGRAHFVSPAMHLRLAVALLLYRSSCCSAAVCTAP